MPTRQTKDWDIREINMQALLVRWWWWAYFEGMNDTLARWESGAKR
jgi:hypothetical protein